MKKEAEKKPKFSRVKDIPTLSGQVKPRFSQVPSFFQVSVEINRELRKYSQGIGEYTIQADPIYAKF